MPSKKIRQDTFRRQAMGSGDFGEGRIMDTGARRWEAAEPFLEKFLDCQITPP